MNCHRESFYVALIVSAGVLAAIYFYGETHAVSGAVPTENRLSARDIQVRNAGRRPEATSRDAKLARPGMAGRSWRVLCTAYCSPCRICCGPKSKGITASGRPATGLCIAAPRSIRFGTRIHVPGYGVGTVLDRGGAIHGQRLDLLFSSHANALKWGRKWLTVTIER